MTSAASHITYEYTQATTGTAKTIKHVVVVVVKQPSSGVRPTFVSHWGRMRIDAAVLSYSQCKGEVLINSLWVLRWRGAVNIQALTNEP
jgi:hypothetical protein